MRGDACFKECAGRGFWGGRGGVLKWASGCNFPLFLVYPVDMPDGDKGVGKLSLRKLLHRVKASP